MEIFLISITAFLVAILTFFSGFGLGTLLTPVFMIFFPVDLAIGLTGVVHFFNNIFKLLLVGKQANKAVVIQFGIPAILAAIIGAWALFQINDLPPIFSHTSFGRNFEVYPVKLMVSILLMIFAIIELVPYFSKLQFGKDKLLLGGILSGFFGGLTGNQGALRAAFLMKAGLTKEAFIGTTVVVSTLVDLTRLSVYTTRFAQSGLSDHWALVLTATISAILGAYLGHQLFKKITLRFLQIIIAIMLIVFSLALGAGFL
ncbi:MAG: sulfite exporter TauE/SafE family protein [Saprospiraceae bacterium]|nr:sulfite exporter TauE/SafE family protein [Saprospiraceae bacterium]